MGHGHFTERVASVDEQASAGAKSSGQSSECKRPSLWVTAIESANSHGKGQVVPLLIRIELEVFGRNLTDGQPSCRDQLRCSGRELSDRFGGTIDGKNMAGRTDTISDLACCCSGTTPDLDHTQTGSQRQRFDDLLQPS